jgi:hypothetical protein
MSLNLYWTRFKNWEVLPAMTIAALLAIFLGIFSTWTPTQKARDILSVRRPNELVSALAQVNDIDGDAPNRLRQLCLHPAMHVRAAAYAAVLRLKVPLDSKCLQFILENKVEAAEAAPDSAMLRALGKLLPAKELAPILTPLLSGKLTSDAEKMAWLLLKEKGVATFANQVRIECIALLKGDIPPRQIKARAKLVNQLLALKGVEIPALQIKGQCISLIKRDISGGQRRRRAEFYSLILAPLPYAKLKPLDTLIEPALPKLLLNVVFAKFSENADLDELNELANFVVSKEADRYQELKSLAAVLVLAKGQNEKTLERVKTPKHLRYLISGLKNYKLDEAGYERLRALVDNKVTDLNPNSSSGQIDLTCKLLLSLIQQQKPLKESIKKQFHDKLRATSSTLNRLAWRRQAMILGDALATITSVEQRKALLDSKSNRDRFLGLQICELQGDKAGIEALMSLGSCNEPSLQLQAGLSLARLGDRRCLDILKQLRDHPVRKVAKHAALNLQTIQPNNIYLERRWKRSDGNAPQSALLPN